MGNMSSSRVMVLKLSKIVHFCHFVLALARNLKLVKQFTYMYPKDLFMHFQKLAIIYYPMAYCFGDVKV